MNLVVYGLLTDEGRQSTAAAETALCEDCRNPTTEAARRAEAEHDVDTETFVDVSGNDEMYCRECGRNWTGQTEDDFENAVENLDTSEA